MTKEFFRSLLRLAENFPQQNGMIHPYGAMYACALFTQLRDAQLATAFGLDCAVTEVKESLREANTFFQKNKLNVPAICRLLPGEMTGEINWNYPPRTKHRLRMAMEGSYAYGLSTWLEGLLPKTDLFFQMFLLRNEEAHPVPFPVPHVPDYAPPSFQDWLSQRTHSEMPPAPASPPEDTAEEVPATIQEMADHYRTVSNDLNSQVIGQENAVQEFMRGYYQAIISQEEENRHRPAAVFLFAGPPGVGKTMLAETAAACLGRPYRTFHMTEYADEKAYIELVGTSSKFKGSSEGPLLRFVRENPKSILIFDEIEKAHITTISQFLQILDSGSLMNFYTQKEQSFRDTVIIFTSNAGRSIYEQNRGRISATPKSVILSALQTEWVPGTNRLYFPAEICSRLAAGSLILFDHLDAGVLTRMIESSFRKTAQQQEAEWHCPITFDPILPRMLLFHLGSNADARIAAQKGKQFLAAELYELMLQLPDHPELADDLEEIHLEMDMKGCDDEIRRLFQSTAEASAIAVCEMDVREQLRQIPGIRFRFADTVEQLQTMAEDDTDFILIDPRYGVQSEPRGISLDDQDTIGVNALLAITADRIQAPVYLLEWGQPIAEADRNSFRRRGAAGVVSGLEAELKQTLDEIGRNRYIQKQYERLSKRGYVLNFRTAQIRQERTLKIQFYGFQIQQAMDAESSGLFLSDEERPKEKLSDVIGAENAKEEIRYFIRYLSNPRRFLREGGKPAKGMLLYGPPGTGKTMLARAMAGECSASFIQLNASQLLGQYSGSGEANIRQLFQRAKRYAPSVIFIDEIDAIGKLRTGISPGQEAVLNALLTEIDGFQTDEQNPVFVLAATNYGVETGNGQLALDPALTRRFDNRIYVDLPNAAERETYLKQMVAAKEFTGISDQAIHNIAQRTPGLSLAILQNILGLAFRMAVRADRAVTDADLMDALEEYSFGEKKDWGEAYCRQTAIHEAGHAYLSCLYGTVPTYVTIESRGNFNGYTMPPESDMPVATRETLLQKIRICLGGRAAEQVFLGEEASLNTGAASDLENATRYAARIVSSYGMVPGSLASIPFDTLLQTPLAPSALEAVQTLLQEQLAQAVAEVQSGEAQIRRIAEALLERNHLTGDEIRKLI